ncbi:Pleckstrin homology domain-containing family G member 7 [Halotydeus destructor]|nr:Pleckstrin homology domain-containing family G member 7 [Halotydeus destructor]
MNLCKSAGGGITARTKSLRERFSSKRSYSELSFKDTSSTSMSSLACDSAGPSRTGSTRRARSHIPSIFEQGRQASADSIRVTPMPSGDFNSYNLMPEDAYCSALDVNCHDGEPRFPWQRDAAVQCDLGKIGPLSSPMAGAKGSKYQSSDMKELEAITAKKHSEGSSTSGPFLLQPEKEAHKKHSAFSGLRFWKSSSPLNGEEKKNTSSTSSSSSKASNAKPPRKSVLQRAASFDGRGGYSRLVQQSSDASLCSSPTIGSSSAHLYVPSHVQTLSPSPEVVTASTTSPSPTVTSDTSNCVTLICLNDDTTPMDISSAPSSRRQSPPLTPRSLDEYNRDAKQSRDRRKRCMRKQPSSAPDSFDDGSPSTSPPQSSKTTPSNVFTFDTLQKLFDLKQRTKQTEGTDMSSLHKPLLLDIPAAGGSSGCSNGSKGTHGYMTLPSPNVQSEGNDETNQVFKKLTGYESEREEDTVEQEAEPPASILHRRRALVPPKLMTDGYESATEETEHSSRSSRSSHMLSTPLQNSRRRSSIVVIPPMQICPGDLLVYSKVLTNRNNLLDTFDGSTQALAAAEEANRKGKNTWSLLRLFDRSHRGKSDSLGGLEEVLSSLAPSVFVDQQLSKYKGLAWYEFVAQYEERRNSSITSGQRLSESQSDTRRSSGQSTLTVTSTQSQISSSSKPQKPGLQRMQTFDSPQNSPSEDSLAVARAHSSRSNSCIVPVDLSVRRLSGGFNLTEEPSLDEEGEPHHATADPGQSFDSSGHSPPVLPSEPSSTRSSFAISRCEHKRREALWDLFQSECVFLYDHLMVLKNVFMEPLKNIQVEGFAMFAEPEVLFGNLDELCCVTYAFCKEFLHIILHQMSTGELNATDVLVRLFQKSTKVASLTQAYHRYTLNYINALNYLETLRRQVEFIEFEKWCSRDPRCKKLQLTDLLVSPVQHIMRVPLILKDIETRTEDLVERDIITNIIDTEETHLRELDDKMKWLKNFERLLEIQRNILWPSVVDVDPKVFIPDFLKGPLSKQPCERLIVSPRRQIILEGPLSLLDSGKPVEMYLILFDDMFIVTRRKKGLNKKQSSLTEKWASSCKGSTCPPPSHEGLFKYVVYKQPLSLDRFYIHDITQAEGAVNSLKYAFVLVVLNRFQQIITCHTFQAPSESVKIQWLTKLRDTADKWKRTLQNTVFRNQKRLSSVSVSTTASLHPNSSRTFTQPRPSTGSSNQAPLATSMTSLQIK